ncbi:hypothetical protein [Conexibacter sp. CPCC 206217]|uniref:hypothetical protein n=1 Tax=Conexibacter sp. CPCC 206217 TaxID=3064574 RepID=UPI002718FB8D|nr:hypothetical protein [Conexibacter sp. CPCC 206217]MDO8211777.1 hypothetical protein [Conexibacter sp. CPCC 206217]
MKRTALIAATVTGVIVLLVTGLPAQAARLITGKDIKDGSITRKDVRRASLTLDRLSTPTQRLILERGPAGPAGPKGNTGARGLTGARGSVGATGPRGASGISGYAVVTANKPPVVIAAQTLEIPCAAGKVVLGGGGVVAGGSGGDVTGGFPMTGNTGWTVTATADPTGGPWQINGYAICANVTTP